MWWTRVFEYRASSGTGLVRRQFQNKKGIKAAIKRDNPGVEDLTTVPRWARVTELNHAITNAKIDASRLLAQEIVVTAVAYDNCLIIIRLMLRGGVGLLSASLPVSLKSRYARVRDGWIIGSSEAWVTSRLVAFSNKRDASS